MKTALVGVAAVVLFGCIRLSSNRPRYEVIPTTPLTVRVAEAGEENPWKQAYSGALKSLGRATWQADVERLRTGAYEAVKGEFGEELDEKGRCEVLKDLAPPRHFPQGEPSTDFWVRVMLKGIDQEHAPLLKEKDPRARGRKGSLPDLLGAECPVCVAVTPSSAPPAAPAAEEETPPPITSDSDVVQAAGFGILKVGPGSAAALAKALKEAAGKAGAGKGGPSVGFEPRQTVTLSVSTALNSPALLDRIEYVSTYVYLVPYGHPPSGGVELEKEYWRHVFALQMPRGQTRPSALEADMHRALDDMRVRVLDVETKVKLQDVDLGAVRRTERETLGTQGSASVTVPVSQQGGSATAAGALSYASEVVGERTSKLVRQLDRRSTYINPAANFVRITQRGMTSANLSGRFEEKLTLSVPAAQEAIPVVVPEGSGFAIQSVAQPLYSRVMGLTLSVVVVRQPTALRRTSDEMFGLEPQEASNARFVVGVTPPSRITLWQWERTLMLVQQSDLTTRADAKGAAKGVRFDSDTHGVSDKPLYLAGFTATEADEFLALVRGLLKVAVPEKDEVRENGRFKLQARRQGSKVRISTVDEKRPRAATCLTLPIP